MNAKRIAQAALAVVAAVWMSWVSCRTHGAVTEEQALRLSGVGGGPLAPTGGGISQCHLNSSASNLASGACTSASGLDVELTDGANIVGTGSAGSGVAVTANPSFGQTSVSRLTNSGMDIGTAVTAATALSADTADWDPAGTSSMTDVRAVREAPTVDILLKGMLAGTAGQEIELKNTSSSRKITLTSEDSGETTASRRFKLPDSGSFPIRPQGSVLLRYSGTDSRWEPRTSALTDVGTSLSKSGSIVSVNLPVTTCSAGSGATAIAADGTLTCSANVSSVVAGTGISASTTSGAATVSANLAGGTCSNGQAVTSVSSSGAATCSDVSWNSNLYGGTHLQWSDEFMAGSSSLATQTTFMQGSVALVSANSAGLSANIGTTTRPGIIEFTSGTSSAAARVGLISGTTAVDFGSGNWTWEWVGGVGQLSDGSNTYALLVGFFDTSSAVNQTNGCYFEYDEGNVATSGPNSGNANKWECWCSASSSRTAYLLDGTTEGAGDGSFVTVNQAVAALTLPDTNIYHLKIVMTGATQADFYVNGTKSCQIKTHIPSGTTRTGFGFNYVKSLGTTVANKVDTDFATASVDLTSARSP